MTIAAGEHPDAGLDEALSPDMNPAVYTAEFREQPDRWTLGAMTLFAVAFASLAAFRHYQFGSTRYDLGNFTQAVWSTAHGRFFEATSHTGEQVLRLAGHAEPILVLFAPLWWAWPSPLMLLTAQALALASGALPVYWLARKHLGSKVAGRCVAFAYLLYPSVGMLSLHEFHAVTFAIPFLLFATWYLDEERLWAFAAWAVLAAATKEQIGLMIAGLGVWHVITRRRYRTGSLIALAGIAWSVFAFVVVIPHFSPSGENPFAGRYAAVGGTPAGILQTAFLSPEAIARAVFTSLNGMYLVALVLPVAGICLLAPVALIPALPELAINLLSERHSQKLLTQQYVAGIVPFILLATIYAISKRPERIEFRARLVAMSATVVFLLCVLFTPQMTSWLRDPVDRQAAGEALRLIPDGVPVSVSGYFGAHLAERRRLLDFPIVAEAKWIIVDRTNIRITSPTGEVPDIAGFQRALSHYKRSADWHVVFERNDIVVMRRT